MSFVVLGRAVRRHPFAAHGVVPALLGLLLIGLYFSGSSALQAIVAPTIEGLHPFSWREFGALEWLQNLLLIVVIAALSVTAVDAARPSARAVWLLLVSGFVFVLLEEVDYGAHLVEFFTGELGSLDREGWNRNLHNRTAGDGVQYGSYMRLAATVFVVCWFVLLPLGPLLPRPNPGPARWPGLASIRPSRWSILTVVVMVGVSSLAHRLDDAGLAVIDGVAGNLDKNISEFRELILYYLFAVYFVDLRSRLHPRQAHVLSAALPRPAARR